MTLRNRLLLAALVAVTLSSCTKAAFAQLLWPKVEYGMGAAEVMHLVPGSNEDRGSVQLEGFRYAEETFNVRFEFRSDRLVQVHLGEAVMQPNAITRKSFDRLVSTLRRTYGEPSSQNIEERGSGLYGEAIWRKPGSEITVTISPSTQHHSTILFNFFSRK